MTGPTLALAGSSGETGKLPGRRALNQAHLGRRGGGEPAIGRLLPPLNMGELERLGYVEPNLKAGGQRILCFVHEEDRGINIAARQGSSKKLLIGIY